MEVLFLHDNAPAHRALVTHNKLGFLGFQYLEHTPCSLDLAPSHYHLFPGLKKTIERSPFSSDAEVIAATKTWLDGKFSECFWVAYKSYKNGLRSILSFVGSMFNKSQLGRCSLFLPGPAKDLSAHPRTFCPQSIYVFVFISEQTATCATYSINWLVFTTEMKSFYSAVRTGSLNKAVCASSLKG